MVTDTLRRLIYATVSPLSLSSPNTVAVIDPTIPAVVNTFDVGHAEHLLALTDDARYLWVSTDGVGSATLNRIDLETGEVDLAYTLGIDSVTGQLMAAEDMAVALAGKP